MQMLFSRYTFAAVVTLMVKTSAVPTTLDQRLDLTTVKTESSDYTVTVVGPSAPAGSPVCAAAQQCAEKLAANTGEGKCLISASAVWLDRLYTMDDGSYVCGWNWPAYENSDFDIDKCAELVGELAFCQGNTDKGCKFVKPTKFANPPADTTHPTSPNGAEQAHFSQGKASNCATKDPPKIAFTKDKTPWCPAGCNCVDGNVLAPGAKCSPSVSGTPYTQISITKPSYCGAHAGTYTYTFENGNFPQSETYVVSPENCQEGADAFIEEGVQCEHYESEYIFPARDLTFAVTCDV